MTVDARILEPFGVAIVTMAQRTQLAPQGAMKTAQS
jgi:hypothetical protein